MNSNFDDALKEVMKSEGGWSDHPKDPGGATMIGITLATFRKFVKPNATKDDLKNITYAQVRAIYKRQYWDAVMGDDLPSGLDYAVFDFAVNSGKSRAVKMLQKVIKVPADGVVGPVTLSAAFKRPVQEIIVSLNAERLAFLKRLRTWKTFGNGWTSRVMHVQEVASRMAKKHEFYVTPRAPLAWLNPFNWRF